MEYRPLGTSEEKVSLIGLGTMTWGEQNTQAEAFVQMDYALERGVNLWDTAELYAIPPKAETQGTTERIIGHYFAQHPSRREEVFLATKVTGPGLFVSHIRQGKTQFRPEVLQQALEGSLQRLQTDFVDLYQLHWPERHTNYFGRLGYKPAEDEKPWTDFALVLEGIASLVEAGLVRYWGVSNETPWGLMKMLCLAEKMGLPKPVTIQNPYSLVNRSFEVGLAEVAYREKVGLLAYSPLAFGVLTGKYLNGQRPPKARLTRFSHYDRYNSPQTQKATAAYVNLAKKYGLSPAQMALAFVNQQPFITSNLIGATTMAQLKENIDSIDLHLDEEVLAEIEAIFTLYPNPAP